MDIQEINQTLIVGMKKWVKILLYLDVFSLNVAKSVCEKESLIELKLVVEMMTTKKFLKIELKFLILKLSQ